MGIYSRFVFPRLCDCLMALPALAGLRKEVLADVGGDILEIGLGTGLNLAHYPEHVRRITTVDPNPGMNKLAGGGSPPAASRSISESCLARRCRSTRRPSTGW